MKKLPSVIRGSYLVKFAVALLGVVLLIGAAGAYTYVETSDKIHSQIHKELETVSGLEANEIKIWEEERKLTAKMLSENDVMATDNKDEIQNLLSNRLEFLPKDVHEIHYIDTKNQEIVTSTSSELEGASLNTLDAPWTRKSLDLINGSDVYRSKIYKNQGGKPTLAFISPVPDAKNRAIVLTVDTVHLADKFSSPIEGGFTQVVNSNNTVVFDQMQENTLDKYSTGAGSDTLTQIVEKGINGESDVVENVKLNSDSKTKYVVSYTPAGEGWVLINHAPEKNAYSTATAVRNDLLILIFGAFIGLGLIGATIGRNTVKALDTVSSKAKSIADGNIDVEIQESKRDDEVGELIDSFSAMKDYLSTAADQTDAISKRNFDAEVLEEEVPGRFGEALDDMAKDVEEMINDIEESKKKSEELNRHLEDRAEEFSQVMQKAADGDLTQRMTAEARVEAMEEIAKEFNEMMDEIEKTVVEVRDFSEEVAESSERVMENSEEVKSASEEVSASVQQISDGANQQTESIQEVSNEMSDLSATIEEVASSADRVAETTRKASEKGEKGSEAAEKAIEEIREINSLTKETAREIEKLDDKMNEIGEIVELISDVAEQTNILALNANIEAARAGNEGEGFAVVANEVKSLAEDTKESAEEIEKMISEVSEQTEGAVENMHQTTDRVSTGVETVEDALSALDDIAESIDEVNTGIQEINKATDNQASSTQEVVSMVDEIASISEETTSESENVAAAAEEQTSALSEVSQNTRNLSEMSDQLRDLVKEFRVENSSYDSEVLIDETGRAEEAVGDGGGD